MTNYVLEFGMAVIKIMYCVLLNHYGIMVANTIVTYHEQFLHGNSCMSYRVY